MTTRSADTRLDPSEALATAETLAVEGKPLEAIDLLQRANRVARDGDIERRLVRLRHDAFDHVDRSDPSSPWPPPIPDVLASAASPPAVGPDELTLDTLRGGIFGHGCLLVRHLVPEPRVDQLVEGIDRAFQAYEAHTAGAPTSETTPWFEPFKPGPGYSVGPKRKWTWEAGGVFVADSPRLMYDLLDTLEDVGLRRLIAAHFDERPLLSMNKSTLRRVPLDTSSDWHQDGAFLGEGIRTVNVWLCLSHCGRDAPGLDIVARRLDRIVETGTEGASFPWSVAPDVVEQECGANSVVRPIFEPGDVLLFDDLFLHRTAIEPDMTRERYAIETWFFAASTYPGKQIPFVF
jgi:hypothetical protein